MGIENPLEQPSELFSGYSTLKVFRRKHDFFWVVPEVLHSKIIVDRNLAYMFIIVAEHVLETKAETI